MNAKVKKIELLSEPFRLEIDDIRKLWEKVDRETNRETTMTAVCRDNASRRFDSMEELESFLNDKDRRITKLTFYGHSVSEDSFSKVELSIHITLNEFPSETWNNITLSIDGEDEERIQKLYQYVKEVIVSTSPWYRYFIKRTWTIRIIFSFVGIMILDEMNNVILQSPLGQTNLEWSETTTNIYSAGWLGAIILWIVIVGHFAVTLWKHLFPIGKISIGREKNREENRERLRWIAVALSVGTVFKAVHEWVL